MKILYKIKGSNTIYCIHAINKSVKAIELVNIVLAQEFPFSGTIHFSGTLYYNNMSLKFKDGELHNSYNNPAVKDGKTIRLFIDNGKLQSYRKHDVSVFEVNVKLITYKDYKITTEDVFSLSNFIIENISNYDFPVLESNSKAGSTFFYHFEKNDDIFITEDEVNSFISRHNIDKVTEDVYPMLKFETVLDRKT